MGTTAPRPTGFLHSFRAFGVKLLGGVHDRVELFAVELQEEKIRLIQTFIWISAAVFSGMLAVTFGSLMLVYLFWESARIAVLGGLTVFYTGVLVAIALVLRRSLSHRRSAFTATLQALRDDCACIRNET